MGIYLSQSAHREQSIDMPLKVGEISVNVSEQDSISTVHYLLDRGKMLVCQRLERQLQEECARTAYAKLFKICHMMNISAQKHLRAYCDARSLSYTRRLHLLDCQINVLDELSDVMLLRVKMRSCNRNIGSVSLDESKLTYAFVKIVATVVETGQYVRVKINDIAGECHNLTSFL